ncbi:MULTISPECIES: hypothetical protein [Rufibacter]|uniref:Uncharacterized protein n=1 Tax=Rufibacter quisquiliarum TaxID=1549639 RepID=A0A839GMA2_9BACT|nr:MULTISPECIES: hypothetical protein [Rufibacter]MBA9076695.1 hypothetical protein [Rufibacter quisquiliarum]
MHYAIYSRNGTPAFLEEETLVLAKTTLKVLPEVSPIAVLDEEGCLYPIRKEGHKHLEEALSAANYLDLDFKKVSNPIGLN